MQRWEEKTLMGKKQRSSAHRRELPTRLHPMGAGTPTHMDPEAKQGRSPLTVIYTHVTTGRWIKSSPSFMQEASCFWECCCPISMQALGHASLATHVAEGGDYRAYPRCCSNLPVVDKNLGDSGAGWRWGVEWRGATEWWMSRWVCSPPQHLGILLASVSSWAEFRVVP